MANEGLVKEDDASFDEFEGADPQFGEINVLLLGSDSRGDEDARADTLMIAHYNQTTHTDETCFYYERHVCGYPGVTATIK